jgi:hypothetical protein
LFLSGKHHHGDTESTEAHGEDGEIEGGRDGGKRDFPLSIVVGGGLGELYALMRD